jgi:mono/diheme cytochrome c family protein
MNKHHLLSFFALFTLAVVLPVYGWREPQRMAAAQDALRQEFIADAAVMYVENCAICHGAAGEGIGATPALANAALTTADYDALYKTIARGRYGTIMTGWHADEGGVYTDYQIDELIALIRYGDWGEVNELAAAQGLIPPTLPVPEVDEALLAQVAALDEAGFIWAAGMQLFANNCTICHGVNGEGSDLGVVLNADAVRATDAAELSRIITEGVPGTMMVGWGSALTPEEIGDIVAFLQNWDAVTAQGIALTPPEPVRVDLDNPEEVLALGERIFTTTCTGCHGADGSGGTGPVLNSQQILSRNTDEQLLATITNGGWRPNSTMPAFGDRLTQVELAALVDFIRAWEPTAPLVENPRGTAQGGGPPWLRSDGTTTTPGQGQGQGQGKGGPAWRSTTTPAESNAGSGPPIATPPVAADVQQIEGVVVSVVGNVLTVETAVNPQLQAMLGPPWFWQANGIALAPGDTVTFAGFESTDHLELNWLENLTTGERINLRTPTGQPVWGSE